MRYTHILIIAIVSLLLAACGGSQKNESAETAAVTVGKLDKISWLAGNWEDHYQNQSFYEKWEQAADGSLTGSGIMVNSQPMRDMPVHDTFFRESLRIIMENDVLWYCATISGQNDGREVRFKEKELTDSSLVVENLQHDYPQRISYVKTSDSTIRAVIEGKQNGKDRNGVFYLAKIK